MHVKPCSSRPNPSPSAILEWPFVERASARKLALILTSVIAALMLAMITRGSFAASGDAVHYMVIADSVAFDRDFDLGNNYGRASLLDVEPENHAIRGRDGVLRPVHDVGLPVLAAPFFALAYGVAARTDSLPESLRRRARFDRFIALRQLVSFEMILLTAIFAVVLFLASWRMTGEKTGAFLWALVWSLSPPVLTHAYVFFTEVPSAFLALLAYLLLAGSGVNRSPGRTVGAGLLAGLLLLIHVRNVGLVIVLCGIAALRLRRDRRRLAGFAAAVAAAVAAKVWLNVLFWGTAVTTPHERLGQWPGLIAALHEATLRSWGLMGDPRHGLLWSAPIYLLAPAALILLRRRSSTTANECLALIAGYLVFVVNPVTNVHGWTGGWSPPARFLVPIVPFLALSVPLLFANRFSARIATAAIVVLQIPIDLLLIRNPQIAWSEGPGSAEFLRVLAGRSIAEAIPSVDVTFNGIAMSAGLFLGAWLLLTWWLTRSQAPMPRIFSAAKS